MMTPQTLCVCQSGKRFLSCCAPFLDGDKKAKTPTQLMRSRYSAFALGGYGQYLLETWVPEKRTQLCAIDLSQRAIDWQGLEIINQSQSGNRGMVEFKAFLHNGHGHLEIHHERSRFVRIEGSWLYQDGDIL